MSGRNFPPRLTNLPGQWHQCQANGSNVCRVLRKRVGLRTTPMLLRSRENSRTVSLFSSFSQWSLLGVFDPDLLVSGRVRESLDGGCGGVREREPARLSLTRERAASQWSLLGADLLGACK